MPQGVAKILERPLADPVLRVGRDVGRVERAEGRRERAAAGEAGPAALLVGVAAVAVRGVKNVLAAPCRVVLGEGGRRGEDDSEKREDELN